MALVYLQVQTCIFIRGSLLCSDYNFYSSSGHHWPFLPGCRQYHENTQTISIVTPRLPVPFHTQINMHKIQTQAAFICPAFCTYCTFKQSHQCILIREAPQAGSRERKRTSSKAVCGCVFASLCLCVRPEKGKLHIDNAPTFFWPDLMDQSRVLTLWHPTDSRKPKYSIGTMCGKRSKAD